MTQTSRSRHSGLKRSVLLIRPVAFRLIADVSFKPQPAVLFFFFFFLINVSLGVVWPAGAFQAWTEASSPPVTRAKDTTGTKKMRTRRFIIILGRSAHPAQSRANANSSPFPSLSRSLTLPFVSRCLCVCHSLFP